MEMMIWSPDFVTFYKGFFGIFVCGVIVFVLGAKTLEPYKMGHLLCGVALVVLGMGALAVVLTNKVLVDTLVEAKMMTGDAKDVSNLLASVLQITMPAISFSLGTRFIGNWVTTRPPLS